MKTMTSNNDLEDDDRRGQTKQTMTGNDDKSTISILFRSIDAMAAFYELKFWNNDCRPCRATCSVCVGASDGFNTLELP
ncbi:hypothetical protein K1719_011851 [Acacia pycnantha]|nr:hypothetical protein K1719_011851 [Acacia pycnantha]